MARGAGKREGSGGKGGVVYVPSHHLIYLAGAPREGLSPEEAGEALRLEFEENAPLPVDQLATGLLEDRAGGRLAVVGCGIGALPETREDAFVLPGFLPFLDGTREAGQCVCGWEEEGSSLLFYGETGWLPTEVVGLRSRPGDPGFPEEWEQACSMVGWAGPTEAQPELLECREAGVDSRDRVRFTLGAGEGADGNGWELGADAVWNADLRPAAVVESVRQQRRTDERVWYWMRGAAALLVLALLVQGWLGFLAFSLRQKREEAAAQADRVAAIEERAGLVQRLRDLGGQQPSLFRSLGELNLLRPEQIQFLEVEFSQPGEFLIEGRTSAIRPLNDFAERIGAANEWELVERPRSRSREGRIEFELRVRLTPPQGGPA